MSNGIDKITQMTRQDSKCHDLTLVFDDMSAGLTIHSNNDSIEIGRLKLRQHCEKRKYIHQATHWFGICIEPDSKQIKFVLRG